jgi:hypothetical protein
LALQNCQSSLYKIKQNAVAVALPDHPQMQLLQIEGDATGVAGKRDGEDLSQRGGPQRDEDARYHDPTAFASAERPQKVD